jgi:multiple sugar transport system permease protein
VGGVLGVVVLVALLLGAAVLIIVAALALAEWAGKSWLGRIPLYGLLTVGALVTLTPLIWLIAATFKTPGDFFHYNFFPIDWENLFAWNTLTHPWRILPFLWHIFDRFTFGNFGKLFHEMPFLRFLMNSCFIAGATVFVQLFFSSLGGFALAKYEFRGKRLIMVVMLATMMVPGQVTMGAMYRLLCDVRLIDSHLGLIVPSIVTVFGMFLFMQSMRHIPDELLQAGRVDGCTEFGLYWNIALPVSRPMIGAFCLISFMGTWNSFLWPQIILQNQARFTLPIGLRAMVNLYTQEYGALMAGTLLSILPVVVLFFVLQKEFIAGLTAGAVKG